MRAFGRALLFGGVAGGAAWWAARATEEALGLGTNMGALGCLAAGAAAWVVVAAPMVAVMRPPELMFALDKIARKLKLKRG